MSRSNIRSKDSTEAVWRYCGTAERICDLVSGRRVDNRAMTRLSRRSVLADADVGALMPRRYPTTLPDVIRLRRGQVVAVRGRRPGAVELDVRLGDGTDVRALAYPDLTGEPVVGETALLNTTALERGLGTGGLALVVALPDRADDALPAGPQGAPGHVVKARYTPLQTMVLGVDEQESPHHAVLADADDLGGMPVVVADLHSAAARRRRRACATTGRTRGSPIVMTDGGALPAAFSSTVAALREAGWLAASITVGQAWGGDHEAVTVHSALLAARLVVGADVAVVAQGPGNLGTGTRWGFSGVVAGEAVNAAGTLGGRPVASLRVSQADARERHRGMSHHSRTAYGRVALLPADVPVPVLDGQIGGLVRAHVAELVAASAGRLTPYDVPVADLEAALRALPRPLEDDGPRLRRRPGVVPRRRRGGQARGGPAP